MEQGDWILAVELAALIVAIGLGIWRIYWLRGNKDLAGTRTASLPAADRRLAYDMRRDGQRFMVE